MFTVSICVLKNSLCILSAIELDFPENLGVKYHFLNVISMAQYGVLKLTPTYTKRVDRQDLVPLKFVNFI